MLKDKLCYTVCRLVFASLLLFTIGASNTLAKNGILSKGDLLPPYLEVDREDLSVGEVVAHGTRDKNGDCSFGLTEGSFQIRTFAPNDGKTRWLAILLDQNCVAVVNAMWDGALEAGPPTVVEQLIKHLAEESIPVPEEPALDQTNHSIIDTVSTMAPTSTKTSEQLVYMYGYGGTWDKLTKKTGKLTFSYNGSSATITSQSGTCQGSKIMTWEWVVDGCFNTDIEYGPADIVYREGRGNYHCKPQDSFPCDSSEPNGYYHSLFDNEDGHKNGDSHCTFWYSGKIVSGVKKQILQGCN